ncbi:hypothetical protein CW304_27755 [Bacillus sp. UFRGS-B20]|nr:hypothetical protein CW304_27755 [Bacillus sp. UFRGS-B20]
MHVIRDSNQLFGTQSLTPLFLLRSTTNAMDHQYILQPLQFFTKNQKSPGPTIHNLRNFMHLPTVFAWHK